MQARRRPQRSDPRHREARKLRQGLPAEAGAAGAKYDDIARAIGQLTCRVPDHLQIATGFRQPQQRQTVVGVTGAQPFQRAFRARQRGLQRIRFDAVQADVFLARTVDGLKDAHAVFA